MKSKKIVCFGEILWDLFPNGKRLGGAPYNVANSLKSLGADVYLISRFGKDTLGDKLLEQVKIKGVPTDYLQIDPTYETGKVIVSLDSKGSAQYEIKQNVAWDFIEPVTQAIELVNNCNVFVFGSLIARSESYKALNKFLNMAKFSVFDLNLRPPFYNKSLLEELMLKSDMLKFNDEELYQIAETLGSPFHSMDQHITFLSKKTNTKIICVTKGMYGSVLYYNDDWYYNSGYKVQVEDTVGAGDSFLATLIFGLLNKRPLQQSLDEASAMGALVASKSGANHNISEQDLNMFMGKDF